MPIYHVSVHAVNDSIFRLLISRDGQEFSGVVEAPDDSLHDAGSWPTFAEACESARTLADGLCVGRGENAIVAKHRAKGALLIVAIDSLTRKWSIIAGYRPFRFDDTGLRFDTQEEARKVLCKE